MNPFLAVAIAFLALGGVFAYLAWKKSQIETGLQIQCSSGDSEVMSFNVNFVAGESEEEKEKKIHKCFAHIQDRRDENHAKWLEMKAAAIAENEKKDPAELRLASVTEGKSS